MKLSKRIEIYVPVVPGEEHVYEQTMVLLSGICGGATALKADGAWIDGQNKLVHDDIILVYAYYNRLQVRDIKSVLLHVKQLKQQLRQELISVTFAGSLHLI